VLIEEIFTGEVGTYNRPLPVANMNPEPSQPQTPPITQNLTPQIHVSRIIDWANAIKQGEGADPASNNPGNLKYATLTASWEATKGRQAIDGGFLCQFSTYQQGFQALCNFLTLGAENELVAFHQARTLQAFTEVYAGNPPQGYIQRIADTLQVPLTIDVSKLL